MKKVITIVLLFLTLMLLPDFVQDIIAQPPPTPDPEAIPIDGGLGILIAAGAAYGAKKLHSQRKEAKNKQEDS